MGLADLSTDQRAAIETVRRGDNVLLTGVAGTGKTRVLNEWLDTIVDKRDIAITASTGIAATHIGGQTVHRWAGVGICEYPVSHIVNEWFWRNQVQPVIENTNIIIIDEISMLDAQALDLIDGVCRYARDDSKPFGGMQVVFVGDMGQLPPVKLENGFPFDAKAWKKAAIRNIELTKVWRQEDAAFVQLLQEIRAGGISKNGLELLMTRRRAFDPDKDGCTRLMTHNEMVDRINDGKLTALAGPHQTYVAIDSGHPTSVEWLDKNCLSPKELHLKVGARVMFTKNTPEFSNGELGTVTKLGPNEVHVLIDKDERPFSVQRCEWKAKRSVPKRRRAGDETQIEEQATATRLQFPLRLAWAITIHKSQGMTIDRVSVDLGQTFAPGQVYVALSRVRSLEGLNIERWGGVSSIRTAPEVLKFLNSQKEVANG